MPVYQIKNSTSSQQIGIWKIDETKEQLINLLANTGFDVSKVLTTKNQQKLKQWLATRLLLAHFFEDAKIIYDDLGKPSLNNGWKISISHSNEFVAFVIHKDKDCGIDIEKISPKVARIKHKFLNPIDLQNVTTLQDLTIYWSAKEALYKYYGKKEVLFIEHLFIEGFNGSNNTFTGIINLNHPPSLPQGRDLKKELQMAWENIEDFVLVYTL